MKTLFAVALYTTSFSLLSCGTKPTDIQTKAATTITTPTSVASSSAPTALTAIANKMADCTCETVHLALKYRKEIDAVTADKKAALEEEATNAMSKIPCIVALEEEAKTVPAADQPKLEAEIKNLLNEKCAEAIKEMDMQ